MLITGNFSRSSSDRYRSDALKLDFAPQDQKPVPIESLSVVPGCLVEFRCEVRSVVRTQIAAYSRRSAASDEHLLIFRPESSNKKMKYTREVDCLSLGCVIRDPDTKTLTPVIVKVFDDYRDIKIGNRLSVLGILSFMPSFDDLVRTRQKIGISEMLEHDKRNPNPPGARRVHAIFVDKCPTCVREIPDLRRPVKAPPVDDKTTWCVLQ